jgi:hypothetical protein
MPPTLVGRMIKFVWQFWACRSLCCNVGRVTKHSRGITYVVYFKECLKPTIRQLLRDSGPSFLDFESFLSKLRQQWFLRFKNRLGLFVIVFAGMVALCLIAIHNTPTLEICWSTVGWVSISGYALFLLSAKITDINMLQKRSAAPDFGEPLCEASYNPSKASMFCIHFHPSADANIRFDNRISEASSVFRVRRYRRRRGSLIGRGRLPARVDTGHNMIVRCPTLFNKPMHAHATMPSCLCLRPSVASSCC